MTRKEHTSGGDDEIWVESAPPPQRSESTFEDEDDANYEVSTLRELKLKPAFISPALGLLGLGFAYLFFRFNNFFQRIDLGENDFAGLFYILVEVVLLFGSCGLSLASIAAAGIAGIRVKRDKWLARIGISIGILALLIVVAGLLR